MKAGAGARFFTGKPCVNGHIAERYRSSNCCVVCSRETDHRRNERNRIGKHSRSRGPGSVKLPLWFPERAV